MDTRVASNAHPAFVEVIKQLEGEEARLLGTVLRTNGSLPIAQIRTTTIGQEGWKVAANNVMNLCNLEAQEPVENPANPAMVDNWLRLGLIEVRYDEFLAAEGVYAWVTKRPEYQRIVAEYESESTKVSFERGRIGRTAFGHKFAAAVGLLNTPSNSLEQKPVDSGSAA